MDTPSAAELRPLGPATRADAEVRAVLSALRGLSSPAEVQAETPTFLRTERYTRLRLHAQGGLGQVWLGRDELVGRDVAIKEPRTDRPGEAARVALERESWVLGQLQHPNIVPLYDLVRDPDGRAAYYIMPFLGGDGLHDLAARFQRSRPPGLTTRLTLLPLLTAFLDVCAAIDHAHGRGVLHLDIKGDNVKLGPAGAAVVLDWGLARLVVPAEGEPPAGAAGGTPAFMAPEQAEYPADRLGPHTDIYGLGALLYLLLTGRPPHPEVVRCSRDELAAALRRPVTPPHALWSGVPAALEAICLKALMVEPAGRYGSVAALRDDVQHWLADEPVMTHRERLPERLARWGRRHKRTATAAAAVLVTTVLALIVGLLAVNRERQETDRQRQAAEAALALERDSFRQALKAGDDYFTAVSDSPLLKAPGQQPLRRELLQRGLFYYQDFLARRGDEPALRAEVAAAWFRVGQTQGEIGKLVDALTAYERAITMGEELLAAEPENVDLRAQVVRSYTSSAWSLRQAGRYAEALSRLDRADALAGGLPAGYTSNRYPSPIAGALSARSAVLADLSDQAGACRAAEQAEGWFARSEQDPRTRIARGGNLTFLGYALRDLKRPAEAADAFHSARSVFEALLDQPDWSLTARWHIGNCDNALGLTASDAGDHARAMASYEAAHATRRQLVEQNPTVHSYRAELATTCMNLALEHRDHGDPRHAAELSREACAQAEELMGRVPANFYLRSLAARTHRLAAGDAEAGGDLIAAARLRAHSRELLAGFGATIDRAAWQGLASDAVKDGLRQLRWGHWLAAVESFRQAWVCQWRANRSAQPPDQRASASRQ